MHIVALLAHIDIDLKGELTLGDLVVGVGTLALAGFTSGLARSTKASVNQAALATAAEDMP